MHLTSTLLFLFIGRIAAQESSGSSTTTVFETVYNTYTITRNIDCEDLSLCENLAWNPRPGSPAPGNNGTEGPPTVIPLPFDPDFTSPTTPSSTASDGSSATGEPFEFLLRGDGVLSKHFIAFDENKATVLVQSGKEPQYLQISADGELGTVNTTETTEVVFLRITNDTLPLERRQDDPNTEVYEIGDLLHAAPSEILSSDKLSTFYFSGTVLKLNWKGLIYTFYAVPRDVIGEYSLKMARLGTVVPASFIPLNLNYLRQPSSSTTSITFPTTGTQTGVLPTTSASPTSVDSASVTLVYDIITSFGYKSFCSEYLEYTGTVSRVSTEESSVLTGTLVTTSTDIFEKFVYTSTETTYTATTTVTTDATAMERREIISPVQENGPRAAQAQIPFLLATFNAAEISLGCSSAVPARETSTEHSTTTRTVSYESTDLHSETSTTEISTASLLTAAEPLKIPVPANGYWWVADASITEFYHQHLTVIHDDTGVSYEELTQATASTVWFNLQWNDTAQAYNPYWHYTYTTTIGGAPTSVSETRWLWYYVERDTMNLMLPQLLTEEVAAAKPRELRKALFTVDTDGFLKTVGEPVIYICQWRGSNLAFGYSIYTFWGPRTGFLELLKAALILRGDTATEPFGCENVSDALQVIAFAGDSLGKK
ncbi:hypothetical protein TWF569_008485 [Orbilia oligospora]|uniref:Uncharacterized protein n=1 Tax=Orbilia oligospora TaxID=2813651 RepID=A0A7C8NYW5_ORBOL|nr:hypothetical protein TWF569_008485 [Orbilia oligospora]KAF3141681.1 hypothetical protein TWF703_001702 [Orbilia oligospora]